MPEFQIIIGDALQALQAMPEASVDCIVTSPPYWGLRDYGHAEQLGLEPTPEAFVASMVEVFREVRRVLKPTGTCWMNMGDSYAGGRRGGNSESITGRGKDASRVTVSRRRDDEPIPRNDVRVMGLKPKDMVGMPWRLAFAMQADGWYLRQDIIWAKPNPMPESVTDRCTKAHEYLFLLTKSEKYFYDADAIREPLAEKTFTTFGSGRKSKGTDDLGKVASDNWSRTVPVRSPRLNEDGSIAGANRRSVWTIATQPVKEAHFATFPEALVMPCVLAGCPEGGLVLDPFTGSGTTGVVALKAFRRFLGIELNPAYAAMANRRIAAATPGPALFNQQERATA